MLTLHTQYGNGVIAQLVEQRTENHNFKRQ